MAKNWTIAEAVKAYKDNDKFAILDIGKRFPLFADLAARIAAGDANAVHEMLSTLPDYMTANKVNKHLKEDLGETDDDDEDAADDETEEKPAKKTAAAPAKATKDAKPAPVKEKDAKPAKAAAKKPVPAPAPEAEDEDEDDGDEYEDMTPVELFKLCQKRGIEAKSKRPSKEYIKLLRDADKSDDSDSEDWDDEEEEEKPAKNAKAPAKDAKPAAKSKKAKAEDDDYDWDV